MTCLAVQTLLSRATSSLITYDRSIAATLSRVAGKVLSP
ncbi:hypothetical protein AVDCRST_MAG84-5917 [uncultured Microcoleus sp.]|uniref:Uncharacterized protein n=1 Tax=uncultured Microcoleus sp. TaxID=259945 RepID=A0A6J4NSF5_9CYAN|nr:hypothetical protein AVDCRST_MAG84-5917 [uncultured Microcoleus sp.]